MKRNWKGLLLPPLGAPVLAGVYFVLLAGAGNPVYAFLFGFIVTLVVCAGVYLCAFLPSLWFLSRFTRVTAFRTVALGALLGLAAVFPMAWVSYRASGADSGPPEGTFAEYLLRSVSDPLLLAMPLSGLVTAPLYLALRRRPD